MRDSITALIMFEVLLASVLVGLCALWFLMRGLKPAAPQSQKQQPAPTESDAFDLAPIPAWAEALNGHILKTNSTYDRLMEECKHEEKPFVHPPDLSLGEGKAVRYTASLTRSSQTDPEWYEVTLNCRRDRRIGYAVPISNQVKAESALRDFTQTLTKTFAHLPIGLAIFNSSRELVLFNPAIGDLTNLPIEFLASRPSLFAFLDRLRETQMMPEPKDYKSWRNDMAKLEAAAIDGTYSELWTLPSQLTYRVSGRPHPDGAVAFVFEDISADITLKRRFRSEIEQGHAILDCLDQGIAVFSNIGIMTFTNLGYQELWGNDPSSALVDTSIVEATRDWQSLCRPSPIWGDLRDFVLNTRERSEWCESIELLDGTLVTCRVVPLANGATLVRFQEDATDQLPRIPTKVVEQPELTG